MTPDNDPGWPNPFVLFIPGMMQRYARTHPGDGIAVSRALFLAFCTSLGLFGFVMLFILPFSGEQGAGMIVVGGVAIFTVVSQAVERRVERPLSCESATALAASWRTRLFTRLAFGEATALLGFVAAFALQASWVYFASLPLSAVGMTRAAPTRTALERDQQELTNRSCDISLVAALQGGPYTQRSPEG